MNVTTTPPAIPPLLLSLREAAKALAISDRTLWSLTQAGEIPVIRFGRTVRYSPADLEKWIASKRVAAVVAVPVQTCTPTPAKTEKWDW